MNEYEITFLYSVAVLVLGIMAYFLCWIGQWAWAWVDDTKVDDNNALVKFLALSQGYKTRQSCDFPYEAPDGDSSDGAWPFVRVLLIMVFVPWTVLFYPVGLSVLGAVGLAFMTRLALRQKKLLKSHIEDKDAHK